VGLLWCLPSFALPVVSVDLNPEVEGIQSTLQVVPGASFSVSVEIQDVPDETPLNGFQLDLEFDPSALTARSVVAGSFLQEPLFLVPGNNVNPPDVNFAAATVAPIGSTGAGSLAIMSFLAQGEGVSELVLSDVVLSGVLGTAITAARLENATVTVIPELSSGSLLCLGSFLLAAIGRAAGPLR
jgi:hypothetical protein